MPDQPAAIRAACSGLRYVEAIKVYRLSIDIPKETAPGNLTEWVDKYLAVAILNDQSKPEEFKTEKDVAAEQKAAAKGKPATGKVVTLNQKKRGKKK